MATAGDGLLPKTCDLFREIAVFMLQKSDVVSVWASPRKTSAGCLDDRDEVLPETQKHTQTHVLCTAAAVLNPLVLEWSSLTFFCMPGCCLTR